MEEGSIMLEVFEVGDLIRHKWGEPYGIVIEVKHHPLDHNDSIRVDWLVDEEGEYNKVSWTYSDRIIKV